MTDRFGVLGHPVGHSLSPRIHRTFYQRHGIDATYEPVDVPPADLPAFLVELARTCRFRGLNVTTPHKEALFAATHPRDPVAERCRAVNTLGTGAPGDRPPGPCPPGQVPYRGYNTDGAGFMTFLQRELSFDARGRRVVMLGAGGAARSVLVALERAGARVTLVNRGAERLQEPFFRELGGAVEMLTGAVDPDALFAAADLVVHATSYGLSGSAPGPLPWSAAALADRLVVDLNYRAHGPTPFLAALGSAPRAHDGRGMLLHQAAEAFRIWFGFLPDTSGMLTELSNLKA